MKGDWRSAAVVAAVGLAVGMATAQQPREREPAQGEAGGVAREGGIPRRAVEEGRARGDREEGMEEGLPATDAEPRIKEFAPRWIPPRGDWKLGVWVYNTENGVVITRVARGSAAEREGLEPGDQIVNVGGYQVGYVGDWFYPLGYELQRQAGRRGEVLLLVQNVRGKELVNLRVQLDRGAPIRPFPRERG
jgi:S1-C subfamily serine protease